MLRLWRERLLVALAPDALSWVRLHRGLNPALYEKRSVALAPAADKEPWHGALDALRNQAVAWRDDAVDISIVLSNQFVRYALVPHSANVGNEAEHLALAKIQFGRVHGESAQHWDIRLSPAAGKSPRLASAVDTALIEGLRAAFADSGRARLVSVQPWLMSAFNCARRQVPAGGTWLLLIEAERACVALIDGKAWSAVHNVKGHYHDADAWAELLERLRWRIEIERVPDTVLVQSEHNAPLRPLGTWKPLALTPRWPKGALPDRDRRYGAALTAL